MSPRLLRLFRLLQYLVEGRSNIWRLQEELAVCRRQVFRDIATLRMVGYVIAVNEITKNYEIRSAVTLPGTLRNKENETRRPESDSDRPSLKLFDSFSFEASESKQDRQSVPRVKTYPSKKKTG